MFIASPVIGIDPGIKGAIGVFSDGDFGHFLMPIKNENEVDFLGVVRILKRYPKAHIFLERAVSFGMGITGAFNYGRGFATLEIAILICKNPVTYVEPKKWTKEMHAGISNDLKPKIKSDIAAQRLFPRLVKDLPRNRNDKIHDGALDALLIAGYGVRVLNKKRDQ